MADLTAYAQRELEIACVRLKQLSRRIREQEVVVEEHTAWALQLKRELAERDALLVRLQAELEGRTRWAAELDAALAERNAFTAKLGSELEERTGWAMRLSDELEQRNAEFVRLLQCNHGATAQLLLVQQELEGLNWARPLNRRFHKIRTPVSKWSDRLKGR